MTKQKAEIRLVEVWKDFDPVFQSTFTPKGTDRTYLRLLRVTLQTGKEKITSEADPNKKARGRKKALKRLLPEMIESGIKYFTTHVSKRTGRTYASMGYYIQGAQLGRRKFYKIGRKVPGQKDYPLYINIKTGKLFFQESHIKADRKHLPNILSQRLGAIGVKTTQKTLSHKRVKS